jgi:monofunctional glycosyltransferase
MQMAEAESTKPKTTPRKRSKPVPKRGPIRRGLLWVWRGIYGLAGLWLLLILLFSFINPPTNLYQMSESRRLGGLEREWVDWDAIAPVMARSAVAAEDANFCLHFGFDMAAIRDAIDAGSNRGASTISQQVVKNVFLWQGRSWLRKAIEATLTPVVELFWSKQRILEVYLNIAEFDEGVFGVQAAAQHYFGVDARDLTPTQAARLAAVLPDPKGRDAADPGPVVRRKTGQVISGAETIAVDGRAACFE